MQQNRKRKTINSNTESNQRLNIFYTTYKLISNFTNKINKISQIDPINSNFSVYVLSSKVETPNKMIFFFYFSYLD